MRIAIILGSLLLPSTLIAAERVVERTIEVNADVHFVLASHRGSVEIETADVDTVEIVVIMGHEDEDVLDEVVIDIDSSASRVSVSNEYRGPGFPWFSGFFGMNNFFGGFVHPEIRYRIILPEQASLSLNAHRSELTVEAPSGRVDISSHRSNGDIRNVRNDLSIDTHRGDFDVDVVQLHDIDLVSHRGDINLDIAAANDFTLRGESHRGNLRFTGKDIEIERDHRNHEVRHTEGDGRNFIEFDAHRGNVRINFLD